MESRTINPWDKMIKNPPEGIREYLVKEKEFLTKNITKNDMVLEIGCGTGRTVEILSKISRRVIAIDNDEEAVKKAKQKTKLLDNVEIILEDGEKTNFDDKTFDAVFIGMTFPNFDKTRDKILHEIRRTLKDKGVLLFSAYNENSLSERLLNYETHDKGNYEVKENGRIEFNFGAVSEQFSKEQIIDILENNKLKPLEIVKLKTTYLVKASKFS